MKLSNLNEWLTLLTNVGVLAGIVFLGIEMQQNTQMMHAQTRDSVTDKLMNWYIEISTDQNAAELLYKGNQGEILPDTVESLAYSFMVLSNLRMWENEWYQYQIGLFDETEFNPRLFSWGNLVRGLPGYASIWENASDTFSPDFRELIDGLMVESSDAPKIND